MPHTLPSDLLETCDGFLYCWSQWAYDVTGGLAFTLLLLGFVIVLFMGTQRFGTPRSFGFSSIIGLLASIWLATMNLMPWWVASAFILAGLFGFAVLIINEK